MVRIDGGTFACRAILLFVVTAAPLAVGNAQPSSGARLDALIETIRPEVHPQDAMERMRQA